MMKQSTKSRRPQESSHRFVQQKVSTNGPHKRDGEERKLKKILRMCHQKDVHHVRLLRRPKAKAYLLSPNENRVSILRSNAVIHQDQMHKVEKVQEHQLYR